MNNRRDFLVKGSLAAAAIMVVKPFESIAGEMINSGFIGNENARLVFLHTPYLNPHKDFAAIQKIKDIKSVHSNALLLNAYGAEGDDMSTLVYDASINDSTASGINKEYKILKRGAVTTGIISALPSETNVLDKVNRLAAYLKKEKKCTVVVCLSQLGYKNNEAPDDITLASFSEHLDIIVGGHASNFHQYPVIMLNKKQAEVIIHASSSTTFSCGQIEIDFDSWGRKKQVGIAHQS